MDDLISRQAAIDAISLLFDKAYIEDADVHKNDALYELNLVPTAEKRGKWLCSDDMYETAICSCCGWNSEEAWENIRKWFKYCPNCGARMEE